MRSESAFAMVAIVVTLSGCGGGPVCCVESTPGSGGIPVASFSAFSETAAGETVRATALSRTRSSPSQPATDAAGTIDLTLGAEGTPTTLDIVTDRASAAWSGDDIRCSGARCSLDNGEAVGALINPRANEWNYQTFGYWVDPPASASRVATAFSIGNPTPAATVMSGSRGTYVGTSVGVYINGNGSLYEHSARMRAEADFGNRAISFSTTGTRILIPGSSFPLAVPQLDMAGQLTIDGGSHFSGPVQTAGFGLAGIGSFRGTASGTFYGPQAEEIGGVYSLVPFVGGSASISGAFGGKR